MYFYRQRTLHSKSVSELQPDVRSTEITQGHSLPLLKSCCALYPSAWFVYLNPEVVQKWRRIIKKHRQFLEYKDTYKSVINALTLPRHLCKVEQLGNSWWSAQTTVSSHSSMLQNLLLNHLLLRVAEEWRRTCLTLNLHITTSFCEVVIVASCWNLTVTWLSKKTETEAEVTRPISFTSKGEISFSNGFFYKLLSWWNRIMNVKLIVFGLL